MKYKIRIEEPFMDCDYELQFRIGRNGKLDGVEAYRVKRGAVESAFLLSDSQVQVFRFDPKSGDFKLIEEEGVK